MLLLLCAPRATNISHFGTTFETLFLFWSCANQNSKRKQLTMLGTPVSLQPTKRRLFVRHKRRVDHTTLLSGESTVHDYLIFIGATTICVLK